MFSLSENCCRIPPQESTVEAWEYYDNKTILLDLQTFIVLVLTIIIYSSENNHYNRKLYSRQMNFKKLLKIKLFFRE